MQEDRGSAVDSGGTVSDREGTLPPTGGTTVRSDADSGDVETIKLAATNCAARLVSSVCILSGLVMDRDEELVDAEGRRTFAAYCEGIRAMNDAITVVHQRIAELARMYVLMRAQLLADTPALDLPKEVAELVIAIGQTQSWHRRTGTRKAWVALREYGIQLEALSYEKYSLHKRVPEKG